MNRLETLRKYFYDWQAQGYDTRPLGMDHQIDERINKLTNVELLELLDRLDEIEKPNGGSK